MAIPRWTTGSLKPTFVTARLVSLTVKPTYTYALAGRLPSGLSGPSRPSVTLWEGTAPVKLTRYHCSLAGLRHRVRSLIIENWYFILRLHSPQEGNFGVSQLCYVSKIKRQ